MTNPAGARRQLLGVSDRSFQETIAEALLSLGCDHAMVVSADSGCGAHSEALVEPPAPAPLPVPAFDDGVDIERV